MIPGILTVGVGLVQTAVVVAVATTTSPVIASIVGGVFLVINSILTIILTRIIDRRYEQQRASIDPTPKDRGITTADRNRRNRRHGR